MPRKIIVGIDFGTTFSGVAYLDIDDDFHTLNGAQKADRITIIMQWPSTNSSFAEKIPTRLSYAQRPPVWGGDVKEDSQEHQDMMVEHFKLGLDRHSKSHYVTSTTPRIGAKFEFLHNPDFIHPRIPGKKAVDFTAEYLERLLHFVRTDHLPSKFTQEVRLNISYVITVPAIWSDSAKSLTREAAIRAGIPGLQLELISEPEAAAVYCATKHDPLGIAEKQKFMICDAGGGTVVYPRTLRGSDI
jgi:molecular chaperone DnaK (HSP70)